MEQIKRYILAALFFSLPLYPKFSSLCIIAYAALALITYKKKNLILLWKKRELLFFVILYLVLIIGLGYTINLEIGLQKIQTQVSFLVFPVLFIDSFSGRKDRNYFFQCFNWGLLVAVLICFASAFIELIWGDGMYVVDAFSRKNNIFLYQEFSSVLNLHPTYLSLYLGVALFYLIFGAKLNTKYRQVHWWIMVITFFLVLFLTSSKAGIFSFIIISFGFQLYRSFKRKKKSELLVLLVLILGFVCMLLANPLIYKRSVQAYKSAVTTDQVNESTSQRFRLWHVSLKNIEKKLFFGYGTGSANEVLNNSCLEFFSFSICEGIRHKNTHNQYLNLLLSNGLLVLLPFLTGLFLALRNAVLKKDGLLLLFVLYLSLNCFFESLLERERGVVFFMLFLVLLSTTANTDIKNINGQK